MKGKKNDKLLWRLCQLKTKLFFKVLCDKHNTQYDLYIFASVCGNYFEVCHHCQSFSIYTFLHWIVKKKKKSNSWNIVEYIYLKLILVWWSEKNNSSFSSPHPPTYPSNYIYISSVQVITLIKTQYRIVILISKIC